MVPCSGCYLQEMLFRVRESWTQRSKEETLVTTESRSCRLVSRPESVRNGDDCKLGNICPLSKEVAALNLRGMLTCGNENPLSQLGLFFKENPEMCVGVCVRGKEIH